MQRKIFKRLESYCMEICAIEGLKTYIIAPKCHTEWINDIELHSALEIHQEADRYISWIEKVHKMNKVDLFLRLFIVREGSVLNGFRWSVTELTDSFIMYGHEIHGFAETVNLSIKVLLSCHFPNLILTFIMTG
ncbi:MAG: hypothetical protein IJ861_01745 [Clostridia bacterium]|nr:hypothetical protein [Clostridia bacterium]